MDVDKSSSSEEALERQVEDAKERWRTKWRQGPERTRWTSLPPQVGDDAPDRQLADSLGNDVELSSFWKDGPALLMFWRHYGCGCGMDRARLLREEYEDYEAAGAEVVIVGQGEPERAARYAEKYDIPAPVLCDPDLEVYEAYGLLDGKPSQILFDASNDLLNLDYEAGLELMREREQKGRPLVDDPWLLPGEFVIGENGVIRLAYRYQYCEDFPDPRVLLAAVKEAKSG